MICNLCPRKCNVNRADAVGYCGQPGEIRIARAALHYWEEPCISGSEGSGAVFFSGCNLKCIYCQNRSIAIGDIGKTVSIDRLADIFLELQSKGANNINLVTGNHYIPSIAEAIRLSKANGLNIPIVYNTSSYESVDTLKLLEGLVDIYLPDMKYMDADIAGKYSNAPDYPVIAREAIKEMFRQQGKCIINEKGIMEKGLIVRHLILPGNTRNSMDLIKYLLDEYGDRIYISIMNQYTPMRNDFEYQELNRKVTRREYNKVLDYALEKGLKNGFFQDGNTASESFIPAFDYEGID